MKELILALVIACGLGIGGCSKDNNTVNDNNTESSVKVEEKTEVNEDKKQKTQTSKIIGMCYECGKDLYDNEFAYDFDDGNNFLCKTCYNTCGMCKSTMNNNKGHIIKCYAKICDNCYKHIDICDNCGMPINLEYEESYKDSYGTYCENCYDNITTCGNCGCKIHNNEIYKIKEAGILVCLDCYNDLTNSSTNNSTEDSSISYYCDICSNPVYTYDEQYYYCGNYLCSDCYTMGKNLNEDLGQD